MSFAELSAFMNERDDRAEAKAEKARQEAKAEKAELKAEMAARVEQQRQEMAAKTEEMQALLDQQVRETERVRMETEKRLSASEAISDEQLEALQSRLTALHAAKLLTDEENDTVEDYAIDWLELVAKAPMTTVENPVVDKVRTMIVLSEKVPSDRSFARQLRRKVL